MLDSDLLQSEVTVTETEEEESMENSMDSMRKKHGSFDLVTPYISKLRSAIPSVEFK